MPETAIKARLDVRGLVCPEPLIKMSETIRTLQPGEQLEILADDPIAPLDFAAYCHRTGHALRVSTKEGNGFRFVIEHK